MDFLFNFIGGIFGYILWFFFGLVNNYVGALTLFTLVINIAMLPLSIKRQKAMTATAKLAQKQKEIQKRCGKDQKKYNEELAKMYEKEGRSPLSGCFSTMVLPMILLSGIFGAISRPLQNTLHIPGEKIILATKVLNEMPDSLDIKVRTGNMYEQLQIVKRFDEIKEKLIMFNKKEISDIEKFSKGFNFLGLNLLRRPNASPFGAMLWLVPLFCFLSSVLLGVVNQKLNGSQIQGQGCTKFLPYLMHILPAWFSYKIPAAVGLYWIISTFFNILQTLMLNKYYNNFILNAKSEAARIAYLEIKESQ